MYAVIATGGKQYRVREGDVLDVERIDAPAGEQVDLRPVLLVGDDGSVTAGASDLDGAKVSASVVDEHRGEKIDVFTYRSKTRYRRAMGHRQTLTRLRIDEITA